MGNACSSSGRFTEVFLDYPGAEVLTPANKTTFVSVKIRPQDTDKLRAAMQHARVTVDVTVKVLTGNVSGVYMAVRPNNSNKDNNIVPVGVHHEEPNYINNNSNNNQYDRDRGFSNTTTFNNRPNSAYSNRPNSANPNDTNARTQVGYRQEELGPGGCKLRLLPSHTNNFAANEYYLSIMSGPVNGRVLVSAMINDRDVYGAHASIYGYNDPNAVPTPLAINANTTAAWNNSGLHIQNNANFGASFYRAKNQTDEEYIEELRWKITDLERELDARAAEMERFADVRTMKKLEKQNNKLQNRIDELERELYDNNHGNSGHAVQQLEAQIDQYKQNAKKAKRIIEALNEKVEEKRRLLAIQVADLDELKDRNGYLEKLLKKNKIGTAGKSDKDRDAKERAALRIQRNWRGFQARKKHTTVRNQLSRKRNEWRDRKSSDQYSSSRKRDEEEKYDKFKAEYREEEERRKYRDRARESEKLVEEEFQYSSKEKERRRSKSRSRSRSPSYNRSTYNKSSGNVNKPSSLKPISGSSKSSSSRKKEFGSKEKDAAKVIQRNYRGFKARREVRLAEKSKSKKSSSSKSHKSPSHKSSHKSDYAGSSGKSRKLDSLRE
jgi:uncharacterized protein YukE